MMRSKMRTLVLALLVAACAAGSSAAAKSKDFIFVSPIEATTLDPHKHSNLNTSRIIRQVYEAMYRREENAKLYPILALEATELDPLTWKIKFREGVFFHCGEPLTSKAVKYSWDRLLDPATAAPRRSAFRNVKSVECLGDYEVIVNLAQRDLAFVGVIGIDSTSILCPVCGPKYGLQDFTKNPCGTGAMKLDHWNPGIELVLVRNDKWWGGEAKVDKITYKALGEDASRVMMLMTGDADVIASVPPALVPNLRTNPDVALVSIPSNRTMHLGYNHDKKPFSDIRVRQAINYAMDKRSIIDNVFNGMANFPSHGFVSPANEYAHPNLDMYEYNPKKAKELLAEAGYPDGFSCGLLTSEGAFLMDRQVAEIVQGMLGDVGIKVDIQVRDWGAYQDQLKAGNVDIYLTNLGNAMNDAEYTFAQFFSPGASQNFSRVNNPAINEIIANLSNSKDLEERAQSLNKVQEIFMENAHSAPLYYEPLIYATRADIKGLKIIPNGEEAYNMVRE